jgi:hypothetical protein
LRRQRSSKNTSSVLKTVRINAFMYVSMRVCVYVVHVGTKLTCTVRTVTLAAGAEQRY